MVSSSGEACDGGEAGQAADSPLPQPGCLLEKHRKKAACLTEYTHHGVTSVTA